MRLGFDIRDLAYEIVNYIHGTDFNTIEVNEVELINSDNALTINFTVANSRGYKELFLKLDMWEILSWLACREPKEDNLKYF